MANPYCPVLVQLDSSSSTSSDSLLELARAGGALAINASSSTPSTSIPLTLPHFIFDDQSSINSDSAATHLDSGAQAIISSNGEDLVNSGGIPSQRIILAIKSSKDLSTIKDLSSFAGLLIQFDSSSSSISHSVVDKAVSAVGSKDNGKPVYISSSSSSISDQIAAQLAKAGASPFINYSDLSKFDLAGLLLSTIHSDRTDGLFPTVVTNSSGVSLGLVYSSPASLAESIKTGLGVYQSRSRGLWRKGSTSGATQELITVRLDCDSDALEFRVRQRKGTGFCHLPQPVRGASCFGPVGGLAALEATLLDRKENAPQGSYTARIFKDENLLASKIREEADELIEAKDQDKQHVAFEAADLFYFALARCIRAGVGIEDIERSLEIKAKKITRRKGDTKPAYVNGAAFEEEKSSSTAPATPIVEKDAPIKMQSYRIQDLSEEQKISLLQRPSIKSEAIQELVRPILASVKAKGDEALLELTAKFDGVKLSSPVRQPPFATPEVMSAIKPEVKEAIDVAYSNIKAFHAAQKRVGGNVKGGQGATESEDDAVLEMETMPGVICKRFARPIERVGLYVPGGTAILPSTALMLGIPAQVAKCSTIVLATPPRKDGSIAPEVLYVASLVGATTVLCAGGAQAVGAMAYGTQSCPKVDKIAGPGNQFVTAAKMLVQNDTSALVSIDMPAGPSEVLVMADKTSNSDFVASDLLSQAEHGPDSQVVLVAIDLNDKELKDIEDALDRQARALPRAEVVRKAIEKSLTIVVRNREEAMRWSNNYAPEHLIIQTDEPEEMAKGVVNAGSVFVGQWSPER